MQGFIDIEDVMEKAEDLKLDIFGFDSMPEIESHRVYVRPDINSPETEMVEGMHTTSVLMPDQTRHYTRKAVSDHYGIVQHYEALYSVMEAIERLPEYGTPKITLKWSNHHARMYADCKFPAVDLGIEKSDKINPRIVVVNSCDTIKQLDFMAGAFLVICSNGMVIPDKRFGKSLRSKSKHRNGVLNLEEFTRKITVGFENFSESIGLWEKYAQVSITGHEMVEALEVIGLSEKQSEELLLTNLRGFEGNMVDRFAGGHTTTAWEAYNSVTQWITDETKNPSTEMERSEKISAWFDKKVKKSL